MRKSERTETEWGGSEVRRRESPNCHPVSYCRLTEPALFARYFTTCYSRVRCLLPDTGKLLVGSSLGRKLDANLAPSRLFLFRTRNRILTMSFKKSITFRIPRAKKCIKFHSFHLQRKILCASKRCCTCTKNQNHHRHFCSPFRHPRQIQGR